MADASAYLLDPQLQAAREQAAGSGQLATNYASAAAGLPAALDQAIKEKLDYNKDIITQKNEAFANYTQAAPNARVDYANVWDPALREQMVAKERALAYLPYQNLSNILKERTGSISDIIDKALGAFNSSVLAMQGKASIDRQKYQDIFDWAKKMADIQLQQQQEKRLGAKEAKDPLTLALQLKLLEQYGFTLDSNGNLVPVNTDNNSGGSVQTQAPIYSSPASGNGTISSDGKWFFDAPSGQWLPVVD